MDIQLKKGVLDACLLRCLEQEERYGYDLIHNLHIYFPEVSESTYYAILRRLNREGRVESFQGTISNGPPRRYYRLTQAGRKALECWMEEWNVLCAAVESIFGQEDPTH